MTKKDIGFPICLISIYNLESLTPVFISNIYENEGKVEPYL